MSVETYKYIQTSPDLMLGLPPRCWASLAGVVDGEKIYSGSTGLIKIYAALSATIEGAGRGGCEQLHLDVVSFFGNINQLVARRKGKLNRFVLARFLLNFYFLSCSLKL